MRCSWSKKLDEAAAARATEAAVGALVRAGVFVREASPVKSSLEELFGELTGARAEGDTGEADDAEAAS